MMMRDNKIIVNQALKTTEKIKSLLKIPTNDAVGSSFMADVEKLFKLIRTALDHFSECIRKLKNVNLDSQ